MPVKFMSLEDVPSDGRGDVFVGFLETADRQVEEGLSGSLMGSPWGLMPGTAVEC